MNSPAGLEAAAHALLRRMVIEGRLVPGRRYSTAELERATGYRRAPVRAALARLAHEGFGAVAPQSGFVVRALTPAEVSDQFLFRRLLEGEAAALAAGRGVDGGRLAELDGLCRSSYDPADPTSVATCLAYNRELHLSIARAAGSDRLVAALGQAIDEQERVFWVVHTSPELRAMLVHEHEHSDLLTALDAGDPERARRVAVGAIDDAADRTMRALLASAAVMNTNLASAC